MSAGMDVAYLDAPYIAHVPCQAVLLRMCPPCWEDACNVCWGDACICACRDGALPAPAARCRKCRYLVTAVGHLVACEPELAAARVRLLAESVGAAQ